LRSVLHVLCLCVLHPNDDEELEDCAGIQRCLQQFTYAIIGEGEVCQARQRAKDWPQGLWYRAEDVEVRKVRERKLIETGEFKLASPAEEFEEVDGETPQVREVAHVGKQFWVGVPCPYCQVVDIGARRENVGDVSTRHGGGEGQVVDMLS
jgi:hypothetical protein